MFGHLQIHERGERWLVGAADAALAVGAKAVRLLGARAPGPPVPRRILLLRLERIGDLLMSRAAIEAVGRLAPGARVDLVVGSWNEPIARLFAGVSRIVTLDAPWLARGASAAPWPTLLRRAREWREQDYDWAINFEGDIRSHVLMARSGAARRIGFDMAGGGPLLTDRLRYDPSSHVADNALRLVEHAFATRPPGPHPALQPPLTVPAAARERAAALLLELGPTSGPLVGIHVSGGREIKQWDPGRFGEVAAHLAASHGARLVFTGSAAELPLVQAAMSQLPGGAASSAMQVCGRSDLLTLAALLERMSLFITGDTGPMHLAAAIGTPLVAVFGPSDPRRWGPLSPRARIVASGVDCRPCNRIRRPPARCRHKVPECLAAVSVAQVVAAVEETLAEAAGQKTPGQSGAGSEIRDAG